ncbi:L,D-transpeptidase family protein [Salmonirosea aquatica]|uniref:L,D-transpeptidase family protein n=1 Tax=Salmonirosea aquatica TaxID=2654236 RepID=A0A7C9B9D8_9BACT|nr:L,D-transpeptidase family protein [Cytophagaceae bacterium SJW1-29]
MFRTFRLLILLLFAINSAQAQTAEAWNSLRNYAESIGVDSNFCVQPGTACLTRYFTEIVYGHTPRRMSYEGVTEQIDSARIERLTQQFLAGGDWRSRLDSLESKDVNYWFLKEFCKRCLVDDYMEYELTIEQVYETLNTYRWINRFSGGKYIIVNVPSATLRVVDAQGVTLLDSRVAVGKSSTRTPGFAALVPSIILYPYWNVPHSITVKELLPKIRRNPAAQLEALNLQVIDGKGRAVDPVTIDWTTKTFPYRLRQSTGCDNALGLLKFQVTSPYAIFLHDTNNRSVFSREDRFLSHGCIRVEKPVELANILLGYEHFDDNYMETCPIDASPQSLILPRAIPVLVVYNVLDLDEAKVLRVYKDVYRQWP